MKLRTRLLSLALVLGLILGLCPGALAAGSYADVPEDNWAYPYIEDMTEQGWMEGVDVHRFSPNGTMTRAMFVTVLARMSGRPVFYRCGELGGGKADCDGVSGRDLWNG